MGCVKKLGCLVMLVVLALVAWFTRDMWLSMIPIRIGRDTPRVTSTWQLLTPDGARSAQTALQRLAAPNGPASVQVAPGDLAAYIIQELSRSLPSSADSVEAAAIGDQLYVRARIRTSELGGREGLGPLGALLGERERLQLGGTIRIIEPGSAELQVKEIRVRDITLPRALIPRIIREISRGQRPAGLSEDGLPLRTPPYIGDVRVANGEITLYRAGSSAR